MYNENVLEHYHNPKNVGEIKNADGIGIYMSGSCGDITKFWIKVDQEKITDAKYETQGCAASIACGSALTELIKNKTIDEVLNLTKNDLLIALDGLPEPKVHCSMLADDALKDAIRDYLTRKNQPVPQELIKKHEELMPKIRELEKKGVIKPKRLGKKTRCYSKKQIKKLEYIHYLMEDKHVNISGIKVILDMMEE